MKEAIPTEPPALEEDIVDLLAIEERRAQQSNEERRRQRLHESIVANARSTESPHRYYFVSNPGL